MTARKHHFAALLRGEPTLLNQWLLENNPTRTVTHLLVVCAGAGLYGAAMGCWRSPLAALYVAIKFPLIILLTIFGNALLNAILAPLLGLNFTLRQSFSAVLMSFSIASAVLGAFSPLLAFLVWNSPPMTPDMTFSGGPYNFIKLTHVVVIAFAGVTGNARLVQLLRQFSGNAAVARRVLAAWLAGNLFLGSQLCWILRPFIGSPDLPVEFLRATALRGNFYENVLHSVLRLFAAN